MSKKKKGCQCYEGKVVWDCVWFGSYPQAEVIPEGTAYTALSGGTNAGRNEGGSTGENSSGYSGWEFDNHEPDWDKKE